MMPQFGGIALLGALCVLLLGTVQGRVGVGEGEQEWGYATVRPGAHMFWWLYYTTGGSVSKPYERPLVIWLQGGPGGSSTGYGNFEELGPYDLNLNYRNYTWVRNYNVLFIDNPVGTGFSYAETKTAYARTNAQIALDLVETMRHFYKQLPEFRKVPVYITSESYGGKMAAEFALAWYKAEKAGTIESKLGGVGLGDSWISPVDSVLTWAPFLLQTGMVDTEGYKQIQASAEKTKKAIEAEQWSTATTLWSTTETVIMRVTKNIDFYNILTKVGPMYKRAGLRQSKSMAEESLMKTELRNFDDASLDQLMNGHVKKALNVTKTWGAQAGTVFSMLYVDFMKPVTNIVERLLEETDLKVFVYTGQLDLIVDTPGTVQWVEKLKWKGAAKWSASPRTAVIVKNVIEGYRKSYGNLFFYWINRAGHMVPADNPAGTDALLEDLTAAK